MIAGDLVTLNKNFTKNSEILYKYKTTIILNFEVGKIYLDEIGLVITTSNYDNLCALIMTPRCIGWINTLYLKTL